MYRWGLFLLAGCAQLAGIDNTSKGTDAAPAVVTSLQLERLSIGKTVVKGPENLTPLNASFLVPDAAAPGGLRKVTAAREGVDKWTADTGGVAVPVMYESPDLPQLNLRIIDLPSTTLKTAIPILERQVFEPPPVGSTINVNVSLPTAQAGQSYQLFTVGAWSVIGLAAPADLGTQLAPGPVALTAGNSPIRRLDKITTDDVVMVLRYGGNQLVSHLITSFDQMATNNITGAMIQTPLNQTLDLRVNQNATVARLSTVRPAVGAASFVWRVHAAPGLDYSVINGPQLHAAGVAAPTTPDPQTLTAMYGNPFPFKAVAQWDVRANRTYVGPTGLATTLSAGMTQRAEPTAALALTTPAGLPDRITANATLLTVDNAMVPAPADKPVEVSFISDAATNAVNSAYLLELFELAPPMATMTYTLTRVVHITMATPSTKIPRELFKAGSLYMLRAFSFSGCYTAVASGDLSQMSLPCGFSFADSGVFQVTP
ncbi:MAG: hypothetical protein M4D80_07805 [Myxococcota bacterium]|nr:hypothetical protein [Myxococcota bacterium]